MKCQEGLYVWPVRPRWRRGAAGLRAGGGGRAGPRGRRAFRDSPTDGSSAALPGRRARHRDVQRHRGEAEEAEGRGRPARREPRQGPPRCTTAARRRGGSPGRSTRTAARSRRTYGCCSPVIRSTPWTRACDRAAGAGADRDRRPAAGDGAQDRRSRTEGAQGARRSTLLAERQKTERDEVRGDSRTSRCCSPRSAPVSSPSSPGWRSRESPRRSRSSWRQGAQQCAAAHAGGREGGAVRRGADRQAVRVGAVGPGAYDCSGLTSQAWGTPGGPSPDQPGAVGPVAPHSAERAPPRGSGDLLPRGHPCRPVPGDGLVVQAPRPGTDVKVSPSPPTRCSEPSARTRTESSCGTTHRQESRPDRGAP